MAKHITKHSIFMGGRLIYGGSPIERSLIPTGFLKHFIGFNKDGKAVEEVQKSNEQEAKDNIETECLALYGVDLDKRASLADMKVEAKEAHDAFVANLIEEKRVEVSNKAEADKKAKAKAKEEVLAKKAEEKKVAEELAKKNRQ